MEKKKIKIYFADNEENEELKEFFYRRKYYEVVGSSLSGNQVIKEVQETKPDVLVLEIMMPEKDGFVIMEELQSTMGEQMPKVIFISHLSHSGFISKALAEGASYFMVKPISPDNLDSRINDILFNNRVERSADKGLDEKISNIFISIGIPANIKGYQFLREAVKLAIEEPDIIGSITKRLYPTIAERFDTSSSKVERGMRHAIEVAWNRGKIENINALFGLKIYSANEKPTNGELIALIADKMIMEG